VVAPASPVAGAVSAGDGGAAGEDGEDGVDVAFELPELVPLVPPAARRDEEAERPRWRVVSSVPPEHAVTRSAVAVTKAAMKTRMFSFSPARRVPALPGATPPSRSRDFRARPHRRRAGR
jgi:hypothetical protein